MNILKKLLQKSPVAAEKEPMTPIVPIRPLLPVAGPAPITAITTPESIIEMQAKIMRTGTIYGREFAVRTKSDGPPPFDRDEVRRLSEATPVEGLDLYRQPEIGTHN